MTDKATVNVEVLGVEPVSAGRLVGLATVELDLDGIVVTLQGVRLLRRPDGRLDIEAPVFRHPSTGQWLPAVALPADLAKGIVEAVGEAV